MDIPLAVIERIMRNAGGQRIAEDAVAEMRDSAQDIADEVAGDAVQLAVEDGRSSVTVEDIRRALET